MAQKAQFKILGDCQAKQKILFLHGGPGMDESYFLPYFEQLGKSATLLFLQTGSSGARNVSGFLEEIQSIFAEYSDFPITLLGHSFGGSLALEFCHHHSPKNLNALILMSWIHNTAEWAKDFSSRNPDYQEENYQDDEDFKNKTLAIAEMYFCKSHLDEGKRLLQNVVYDLDLYKTVCEKFFFGFDGSEVLKNFGKPILSVAGVEDQIVGIKHIRAAATLNPQMQNIEMNLAGHFPFVEKTEKINSVIFDFIQGIQA